MAILYCFKNIPSALNFYTDSSAWSGVTEFYECGSGRDDRILPIL